MTGGGNLDHQRSSPIRYQDYVIRDGQLVGDFDGLYRDHSDPWHQSRGDNLQDTRRSIALHWCERLRSENEGLVDRVVEVGCGFGHLTAALGRRGFCAVGVDVSQEAIKLARQRNSASVFLPCGLQEPRMLADLDPDVLIMAEVTWYVLDYLHDFRERLAAFASARSRPTFLIHLLSTYAPGVQRYGLDYFSDLDGILEWWSLDYLESGFVSSSLGEDEPQLGTYFVAKLPQGAMST